PTDGEEQLRRLADDLVNPVDREPRTQHQEQADGDPHARRSAPESAQPPTPHGRAGQDARDARAALAPSGRPRQGPPNCAPARHHVPDETNTLTLAPVPALGTCNYPSAPVY